MDYLERAQIIGHDVTRLKNGETIRSTVLVDSLEKFKAIFAHDLTLDQRGKFSEQIGHLPWTLQFGSLPGASMTRLINNVFGLGSLAMNDVAVATAIFPLRVTAVSGSTVTINTDEVFGPSSAPVAINAGTLIFNGGSITTLNTVITVSADTLQINSGGSLPYHIGIKGVAGATGTAGATGSTTPGQAQAGRKGNEGSPGVCTGSDSGGTGSGGATGGAGGTGLIGAQGLPSLPATITVKGFSQNTSFVVYTQSGAGGQGGPGGQGGAGQQGGNGGDGCSSGCEGTSGGNGGQGGAGGAGGDGGPGGPGAPGLPINISFPQAAQSFLVMTQDLAPPGAGGQAGAGGAPGGGGGSGSGGKHKSDGAGGSSGSSGAAGSAGKAGTVGGAPGNYNPTYT
ncbi:hypothetical protein IC762_23815 [Bradyrhizobium genosp. L]|uniref:hypothetical protein n=1 Tax=Bradyrhizobium genosp. L TaxID=83637 RepID=UPI0018A29F91|nr:hypothetical protein [Bradyrhizobium genosp. L]QPF82756.1 hypothetical protein IC762_23815 [Bradyrhizobium genosp. L]